MGKIKKILGIIPARMASSRFYGKPLIDIGGKTMIQRVYEQAKRSTILSELIVATDHDAIKNEVERFGGKTIMTSNTCKNGTERCADALEKLNNQYDIVINIQGDEPFFDPDSLNILANCFIEGDIKIATLVKKIDKKEEIDESTIVKVVFNQNNEALYFSRAAIPFNRENIPIDYYKHIGIYAFKGSVLRELVMLPSSRLEMSEHLEQLRWLENGYNIKIGFTMHDSNSVDTPQDLEQLKKQFGIE